MHTLVICNAKPKSDSQKVGTWSNPDLMEDTMSRGEGEMNSHLDGIWSFYLNSIFCNSFGMDYGIFFSFFFERGYSILLADRILNFLEFLDSKTFLG